MTGTTGPRCERSVGITDLIAYRDCPRRASYGIKRHVGVGEQNSALMIPEAGSRAAAYGSCVHDAIAALEDGHSDEVAVQLAWNRWGHMLQPEDLTLLREDIANFHVRDFENVRTVMAEGEIRVPLRLADGELAYFRARIDRLYERLDRPGSYILVDYKSSRWAKTEAEVREDLQLRCYDFGVTEFLPEIDELLCVYDQLRYGQIEVRRSDSQREEIREFLIAQMSAYFADQDYQADGLLPPRYNEWCPWCPILESCPVVFELSHFALARIAALGTDAVSSSRMDVDGPGLDAYSEEYSLAKGAMKVLKRFTDSMAAIARELPAEERTRLGYSVTERRNETFPPAALAQLQARLGDQFLELVSMPKTRLETLDPDVKEWALGLMAPAAPTTVISRKDPTRR